MAERVKYGYDNGSGLMDEDPSKPWNTIIVEADRVPVVEGMTIDRSLMGPSAANPMGQFRPYETMSPRPVGVAPGGERTVVMSPGADRFMTPGVSDRYKVADGADRLLAADRRLMGDGYGGVMVRDGAMPGTDAQGKRVTTVMMPEDFAPIRTNDQRIAMSPEAVGAIGNRQIMEDQAVTRDPFTFQQKQQRLSLRKELQAQADQGFLPPGTDARNREIMRGTEERQADIMLKRSRPRDLMTRRNTADQIMTQADATLMTPQVQTQDGVMAGWDPIKRQIVSDPSGAQATAQGKITEAQIQADAKYRGEKKPMNYAEMGIDELTKSFNDTIGGTKLDPATQSLFSLEIMKAKTPEDIKAIGQKYKTPISESALFALKLQMDEITKRHGGKTAQTDGTVKPGSKYEKMKR